MTYHEDRERILRIVFISVTVFSVAVAFLLYRATAHAPVISPSTIDESKTDTAAVD